MGFASPLPPYELQRQALARPFHNVTMRSRSGFSVQCSFCEELAVPKIVTARRLPGANAGGRLCITLVLEPSRNINRNSAAVLSRRSRAAAQCPLSISRRTRARGPAAAAFADAATPNDGRERDGLRSGAGFPAGRGARGAEHRVPGVRRRRLGWRGERAPPRAGGGALALLAAALELAAVALVTVAKDCGDAVAEDELAARVRRGRDGRELHRLALSLARRRRWGRRRDRRACVEQRRCADVEVHVEGAQAPVRVQDVSAQC